MTTAGLKRPGLSGKLPPWWEKATLAAAIGVAALLPLGWQTTDPFLLDYAQALAYIVMALGLNVIVGFAGLLDLGYVAFFAIGAYTMGWLGSRFYGQINDSEGVNVFVSGINAELPGIHLNFLLILVAAVLFTTIAGVLIGLPTLRLRGDYIAIVTLAFGEIIHQIAINGDRLDIGGYKLTNGLQGIAPIDTIDLPGLDPFNILELRPWCWMALALVALTLFVNFRLRDSRLGRAWIALREDEVAAASMGIPMVKTKLLAYGTGAALGGMSGAFLGSLLQTVNAQQFEFSFSIFILAMVILGGLGSIWGVVIGAVILSLIDTTLIPDVLTPLGNDIGLPFEISQVSAGIFGFLLVIMMVFRPQGLLPERRRTIELTEGLDSGEDSAMVVKK